ncbi:PepSY domain-containing protein [Vreelandella alkaliphila]|uniref:PepSY-associated TM helix domain-containing protein n=1 Tax=Vreelandella alkaliphila TaxID=272774 RepID=UPI003F9E4D39
MREFFRQSMAWLHTWVGLLLGWLLYFMFITGTAGYLDTEIDRWMKPELPPVAHMAYSEGEAMHIALAHLEARVPNAERWFINVAQDRENPYPRVFYSGAQAEGVAASDSLYLDPTTGEELAGRNTAGGQALYRMHWTLHYLPRSVSDWLVGVATMLMLVALITGIIIHKKIFKDFFTFRPGKGLRSWLDAHNLVSVVTLPFQLMITYSGLIFMMFVYVPLIGAAWYGTDKDAEKTFVNEAFEQPALAEASGQAVQLTALGSVMERARDHWQGAPIDALDIRHPGDANARAIVRGSATTGPLRSGAMLVFDGVSGELLAEQPALSSPSKAFRDVMVGLHEGLFAGPLLRALYVVSGLLGAAMIATGLVLWAVKRRQRAAKASVTSRMGLLLVEKLNIATVVGLPVAIATYFWANRLLPVGMTNRADWEIHCLFLCWLAMFVHAAARPAGRAWLEQTVLAAAAFGLLPLLNALTTDRHLLASVMNRDWLFAGFDVTSLAFACGFAWLARYLNHRAKAQPAVKTAGRRHTDPERSAF